MLAALAVSAAACDVDTPVDTTNPPGPNLVAVRATTGRDGTRPILTQLDDADPAAVPVATNGHLELTFDRFLLPSDALRQSVCLVSSPDTVANAAECEDGVFLQPTYDPTRRVVSYYLEGETARLAPETLYTLWVFAPRTADDFGFRAFDGAPMPASRRVQFWTGADAPAGEASDGPPSGDYYCKDGDTTPCEEACGDEARCRSDCVTVQTIFQSCITCHGLKIDPETGETEEEQTLGLDLGPDGLARTAINQVAHQTQVGGGAGTGRARSERFGAQMPLILPGDPGQSYVLYKLMANPAASTPCPDPEICASTSIDPTLAGGEIDRLRAGVVVGLPMPANGYFTSQGNAAQISAWIAAGAKTDCE